MSFGVGDGQYLRSRLVFDLEKEEREKKKEETHFELSAKSCSRPGSRGVSVAWLAAGPTLRHHYPSLEMISWPCCQEQAELGHMLN